MQAMVPKPIRFNDYLAVVPSQHHKCEFADIVRAALGRERFDAIAVEQPSNLDALEFAAAARKLYPAPGIAVSLDAAFLLGQRELPAGDEEGKKRGFLTVRTMAMPMVPGDSIYEAQYQAGRRREGGDHELTIEHVDLPHSSGEQRPGTAALPDTWIVMQRGLQAWLDALGDRVESARLPEDAERERYMAARLVRLIRSRRKTLFVCGAAHWPNIRALIESEADLETEIARRSNDIPVSFRVFGLDAAEAWLFGWMDIPVVVASYVRHDRGKELRTAFDIPQAVERLARRALAQGRRHGEDVSARCWLAFKKFSHARLSLAGRWTSSLDADLCHAARACVHERFAERLKREGLRFPWSVGRSHPKARVVLHDGAGYLLAGGVAIALEGSVGRGEGEERTLPVRVAPLNRRQRTEAAGMHWRRMVPDEDHLQRAMINAAWQWAEDRSRTHRPRLQVEPRRWTGDLGRGLDVRRTHRAWARGESTSTYYVRHCLHRRTIVAGRSGRTGRAAENRLQCPVVWVFQADASMVIDRVHARMEQVISSCYLLSEKRTHPGNVTSERVAVGLNLLRGRTGEYSKEAITNLLRTLPENEKARIVPWDDEELTMRFDSPVDLLVGAAVKYAGARVILVADDRFEVGRSIRSYAQARGVELVRLSWLLFGDAAKGRLSLQFTIPSNSRYGELPDYLLRQAPTVPQFNPRLP
ncbi:MAG: hypothetical protein HY825_20095 [Acidobacteria bacterium]|nr:hypothetical protein [Acidobacteriota bacterium]